MKKTYLVSSMLLLTLSSGVAFAEISTLTSSTTKNVVRTDAKNKIASTSEKVRALKQEVKKGAEDRITKKLDKEREKIANRFEGALKNLKKLADKVEAMIAKFESRGNDLSVQKGLLTEAEAKITLAEIEVASLKNTLASTTATSTRKVLLRETKLQSAKATMAVKTAHKAIVTVINSLKPGRLNKTATTTLSENSSDSTDSTNSTTTSSN